MKERLDLLLVNRGLAPSREKAKTMIMEGNVFVENEREDKAGSMFDTEAKIEIKGNTLKYVSRGGLKLEKAMTHFDIELNDKVCMDIGASTGGFTDCMLQNGAKKVYSVDVGYGQFAWKLRQDPRVVCMEKTNIRYVTPQDIDDVLDFASVDVSFISLTKVLGPARELLADGGEMVCLIKPQFEAGREKVGKKGVVRDKSVHEEVIDKVVSFALSIGFSVLHLEYSPIKGPEGNIEYLVHLKKEAEAEQAGVEESVDVQKVVDAAHGELDKKMKNFLIITNYYKDSEARLTNHIKEYIEKKGGSCSTFFSNGETPGEAAPHREDIPENTQGVLVLGGDGTLIRAAAALVKSRLPLIGVNLGTLGYLCELEEKDVFAAVD